MSTESDLKQLEESPGYVPPAGSPPLKNQPAKPSAKPKPVAPAPPKPTNVLTTVHGHLPALPITLAIALLALGAGMTLYKITR